MSFIKSIFLSDDIQWLNNYHSEYIIRDDKSEPIIGNHFIFPTLSSWDSFDGTILFKQKEEIFSNH